MAYINGLFKKEFKLPDGTIATCQQDVNRYLKTAGVAFASDYSDAFLKRMNAFATPKTPSASDSEPKKPKAYKQVFRNILFPAETLETRVDIDKYVNKIRAYLENMMENSDGIEIK